jgi:hypothetical protein
MKFQFTKEIDVKDAEHFEANSLHYYGLDLSRISELLKFQIYCGSKYRLFDTFAASDAVKHLEGRRIGGRLIGTNTKSADTFLHKPLRGLKKKHWADPRQFARNMINEIKETRVDTNFKSQLDSFFKRNAGKDFDGHLIMEAAHIASIGAWESRVARNSMTGHWIVYAEFEEKNYYLCLASHDEGDDVIYERIRDICFKEFDFLENFLSGQHQQVVQNKGY